MAGLAEKGIEVGASVAGSRVFKYAREGKVKQALAWSVPFVLAGVAVWYVRKQSTRERRRRSHAGA